MTDTAEKMPSEKQEACDVKEETITEKGAADSTENEKKSTDAPEEVKAEEKESNGNVKAEPVTPELEQKIIRQVEYYFGDANISRDKFLLEEAKKDEGWIPLTVLLTFNRLKCLSEDHAVIMNALRKSTDDLLELKSDDSAIRRNPARPVPAGDELQKSIQNRTLYVKGFPTEETLDDLLEYFYGHGGESVYMRRDAKRLFKGSVFATFKTVELAKAFVEGEDIKYKDTELENRLFKNDYWEKKNSNRMEGRQQDVKKKEEQKLKKEQEDKEEMQNRMTKCSILKVSGIDHETGMDKIKEFFGQFGKVAWVDFEKGDEHALVRFAAENEGKEAWEKAEAAGEEGKVKLGEKELTASVLEGEEEEAHWKKIFASINRKYSQGGSGRRGRGGYRGGRGNKRRGGGRDGPSEKRSKADD